MAFEITETQVQAQEASAARPRLELRLPAFSRSIGVEQRMAFTEQLALLLDTGVAIHEALIHSVHDAVVLRRA